MHGHLNVTFITMHGHLNVTFITMHGHLNAKLRLLTQHDQIQYSNTQASGICLCAYR